MAYAEIPIVKTPDGQLLAGARAFAYEKGCTVYDALYAVFTLESGSSLATTDKKLKAVAEKSGIEIALI